MNQTTMNHPSPLFASFLVAAGGGTGAVLRYQIGRAITALFPGASGSFPWPTLAANVLGSLAMGVLIGWLARGGGAIDSEPWRLLLGVGLLGGFTTFSSFSLELVMLWERGAALAAVTYAMVSVIAGFAGLFVGLSIMRVAA
ncbi:fluoride efflux transporter CrcB [Croceicoccus hydrothermalis]|uniref:fluoride efflux transporter CrcB n=1 Tax=Croceicoccus hydrothermalis TaxID=2867964 RepID=UPI001EFB83DE|nr:fluoride efflux transporter CrcB [Croceicoccus hydrothermalis]